MAPLSTLTYKPVRFGRIQFPRKEISMARTHLQLDPTEAAIVQAAAALYAALVKETKDPKVIDDKIAEVSVDIAIRLAEITDHKVRAPSELS